MPMEAPKWPHVPIDRYYVYHFVREWAPSIRGTVLNVGAGSTDMFRSLFDDHDYLSVDAQASTGPDLVADGADLPYEDDEGPDCILCHQVLEHVADPQAVVDEFLRILAPGGMLLLTTPFHPVYHPDPEDYWRFTQAGLALLLREWHEVAVEPYGNRRVLSAFIEGMDLRDCDPRWIEVADPHVPLGYSVRATKARVPKLRPSRRRGGA
ncbi:MAG: methyltransferase domain-containing protein [Armatimonadia bacterium]|nr:methyltransferase domain-containing protein [Armatimonadia bacterium]